MLLCFFQNAKTVSVILTRCQKSFKFFDKMQKKHHVFLLVCKFSIVFSIMFAKNNHFS